MTKPPLFPTCPMFGDNCKYCSHEKTTRSFTKIQKNGVTNLYEPKGIGKKVIELGEYCNNACAWVRDLHVCPARWALRRGVTVKPKEKRKYVRKEKPIPKKKEVKKKMDDKKKIKWKVRKGEDTKRTPRLVHTGQQKLLRV